MQHWEKKERTDIVELMGCLDFKGIRFGVRGERDREVLFRVRDGMGKSGGGGGGGGRVDCLYDQMYVGLCIAV